MMKRTQEERYCSRMEKSRKRLERLRELNAPEVLIANELRNLASLKKTLKKL